MPQLSNVYFFDHNDASIRPTKAISDHPASRESERVANLLENNDEKWFSGQNSNMYYTYSSFPFDEKEISVAFEFSPAAPAIASYQFRTANDSPERDPTEWKILVGTAGKRAATSISESDGWKEVGSVKAPAPNGRHTNYEKQKFPGAVAAVPIPSPAAAISSRTVAPTTPSIGSATQSSSCPAYHPHSLAVISDYKTVYPPTGKWFCDICTKEGTSTPAHHCMQCGNFDLCSTCFEKGSQYAVNTPGHPHSIIVSDPNHVYPQFNGKWNCDQCHKNNQPRMYHCFICKNYDLCDSCISAASILH